MSTSPVRARSSRRSTVVAEEERVWVTFYQRVGKDPAIAAEIMALLESDAEAKRIHLALYLCCRESLRLHQARELRNQRIGQSVRWACRALFVILPAALHRACRRGGDVAVACLPEIGSEPASKQLRHLSSDPELRSERRTFDHREATSAQPGPDQGPSDALSAARLV